MGLLQIVHLENNDADAALVAAELKKSAIDCELVPVRGLSETVHHRRAAARRGPAAVPLLSLPRG